MKFIALVNSNSVNTKFLLIQTPKGEVHCMVPAQPISSAHDISNSCLICVQVKATSNWSLQLNFDDWLIDWLIL